LEEAGRLCRRLQQERAAAFSEFAADVRSGTYPEKAILSSRRS
jgi:3-methyl-2-oxobutanoate hydroxymethyltransferase